MLGVGADIAQRFADFLSRPVQCLDFPLPHTSLPPHRRELPKALDNRKGRRGEGKDKRAHGESMYQFSGSVDSSLERCFSKPRSQIALRRSFNRWITFVHPVYVHPVLKTERKCECLVRPNDLALSIHLFPPPYTDQSLRFHNGDEALLGFAGGGGSVVHGPR